MSENDETLYAEIADLRAEVSRLTAELGLQQIHYNERLAEVKQQAHQRGKEEGALSAFEMVAVEITAEKPEWSNEAPRRIVRQCKVNTWMTEWKARQQKREGE